MGDDYLSLLSPNDLAGFNQSVQASDPYGLIGKSLMDWQPNYSSFNAGESALTAFGKAFMGGLMQNYAQNRAADQVSKVVNILPQLRSDPLSVAAPEGVDLGSFNMLKGSAILKSYAQEEADKELRKKFDLDILGRVLGKKADIVGEDLGYRELGQGGENQNSPQAQVKKLLQAEEDNARTELLTGAKYPSIAKYRNTTTALSQLNDIKDIDTASSDIPFATLFIGGLDGSVVREGEYNRVQGANPILAKFQNQLEGALNGTSQLGVKIKRQMFKELAMTQKGLKSAAQKEAEARLKTAVDRGADPNNILKFDSQDFFSSLQEDSPSIPPGMKLQRNKVTGETRLVPIN